MMILKIGDFPISEMTADTLQDYEIYDALIDEEADACGAGQQRSYLRKRKALLHRAEELGCGEFVSDQLDICDKELTGAKKEKEQKKRGLQVTLDSPEERAALNKIKAIDPYNNPLYSSRDDITNARLYAEVYKDEVRYNDTAKAWFIYSGKIWRADAGGIMADKRAQEFARALLIYAIGTGDINYQKFCVGVQSNAVRQKMLKDARAHHAFRSEDLDSNPDLLNCQNGVLNLKTLELLPHNPDFLLSKITNAVYDPYAKGKRWNKFIDEVMQGDAEKIDYLKRICGLCLTTDTRHEECYIIYGSTTRNGKNTFVETFKHMLGNVAGYAVDMQPDTLAQTKRDSRTASGDLARLKGVRMVHLSEPPKRMLLNVELLKDLTGSRTLLARNLYEREQEFPIQFKLIINTNYLPVILDPTLFSSERVKVITFDRHFTDEERDKELKYKLVEQDEISGILNWAVEGLKEYRADGCNLRAPASVLRATEDYRYDSDKLQKFLDECLDRPEPNADIKNILGNDAYKLYQEWCEDNGYACENKGNFFADLKQKGLLKPSGTVGVQEFDKDGNLVIKKATRHNVIVGYIAKKKEEKQGTDTYKNGVENGNKKSEKNECIPPEEIWNQIMPGIIKKRENEHGFKVARIS